MTSHNLDLTESGKHIFGIVGQSVCEHDDSKTERATSMKFGLWSFLGPFVDPATMHTRIFTLYYEAKHKTPHTVEEYKKVEGRTLPPVYFGYLLIIISSLLSLVGFFRVNIVLQLTEKNRHLKVRGD
ncbi:hypothetical protein AVEN_208662-1 [Araneus ventricosus]|uniref:Uncharacterized protein n=1 Tax=Araneus ventricosus TaxID=182803 RepID=A0A4Y2DSG3_ARAVE|nr:hypothetical protein AVEN_208662-1 [Araneus ventricosus]